MAAAAARVAAAAAQAAAAGRGTDADALVAIPAGLHARSALEYFSPFGNLYFNEIYQRAQPRTSRSTSARREPTCSAARATTTPRSIRFRTGPLRAREYSRSRSTRSAAAPTGGDGSRRRASSAPAAPARLRREPVLPALRPVLAGQRSRNLVGWLEVWLRWCSCRSLVYRGRRGPRDYRGREWMLPACALMSLVLLGIQREGIMEGRYRKPIEPMFLAALAVGHARPRLADAPMRRGSPCKARANVERAQPHTAARPSGAGSSQRPSATHAAVAWSGVICMLLAVTGLNFCPPVHRIAFGADRHGSDGIRGVRAGPAVAESAASHAGGAGPGNWSRSLTKLAGLAGSVGFIALLYWLFPEYAARGSTATTGRRCGSCCRCGPWSPCPTSTGSIGGWPSRAMRSGRWVGCCSAVAGRLGARHRAASARLAGEGLLPAADVHLLLRQPRQAAALRPDAVERFQGLLRLGLLHAVLHRRGTGVDDLPDVAQAHGHAYPLHRAHRFGWLGALVCYEPFWSLIGNQYIAYDSGRGWGTGSRARPGYTRCGDR